MSSPALSYLQKYPLLTKYARGGLVNLNAVARLLKKHNKKVKDKVSLEAISMELRRGIAKLTEMSIAPFDFSKYSLQFIIRSNISEVILTKTLKNRKKCLKIVSDISQSKYFISMVEGEKEIVLITDHPLTDILKDKHHTTGLGFVSINFPVELREVSGIYSILTSALAGAGISIHSFHTIGGEIIVLVRDEDLSRTQEILRSLITDPV